MRADYTVTASFAAMCPVSPRLTDQHGAALDPARITQISLRSNPGQPATLRPSGTTWLPVRHGRSTWTALLSSIELQYSVQSVWSAAANTVHAGVERFKPGRTPSPKLTGLLPCPDHHLPRRAVRQPRWALCAAHAARPHGAAGAARAGAQRHRQQPAAGQLPGGVKARQREHLRAELRLSRDQSANLAAVSRADLAAIGGVALFSGWPDPLLSRSGAGAFSPSAAPRSASASACREEAG